MRLQVAMIRMVKAYLKLEKLIKITLKNFSLTAENSEEKKTETKFKPLASINFPKFSGIINKFRKTPRSDDIELGNGPGGKAGLASMETLDDSTKDPWNQENAPDAVDAEKPKETEKPAEETEEKKESLVATIRNYNCSLGEFGDNPMSHSISITLELRSR